MSIKYASDTQLLMPELGDCASELAQIYIYWLELTHRFVISINYIFITVILKIILIAQPMVEPQKELKPVADSLNRKISYGSWIMAIGLPSCRNTSLVVASSVWGELVGDHKFIQVGFTSHLP